MKIDNEETQKVQEYNECNFGSANILFNGMRVTDETHLEQGRLSGTFLSLHPWP
jgi:hypothetical protein